MTGRPWLCATIDKTRCVALVRGRGAKEACQTVASVDPGRRWTPRWSPEGRGWLVPMRAVGDLAALAASRGRWITVTTVAEEVGDHG